MLITSNSQYSNEIGILVSLLSVSRKSTFNLIEGLSIEALDFRCTPFPNSIGKLLKHIATIEKLYQVETFYSRELNKTELEEYKDGLSGFMQMFSTKGNNLDFYTKLLIDTRNLTLKELKKRDDGWLQTISQMRNKNRANNWYKWYHVIEDELNHCGQIKLLLNQLKTK